jgi:hypothetical protein
MNEEEYLKNRVDDQVDWYDKKSATNKNLHNRFQVSEIGFSLLIPLFAGFNTPESYYFNYIIALLGFLVAGIAGIMNHFKFKDKWTDYRTVAESIKQEKYLFITKTGKYNSDISFEIFVENIENLISKENTNWVQHINNYKKEKNG